MELKTDVTLRSSIITLMMRIRFLCVFFCLFGGFTLSYGQIPGSVKQGPLGIYIFMGNDIPCGKVISGYKIERSNDSLNWKLVAEIKTPKGFDIFKRDFNKAKDYFPSYPTPPDSKLNQIFQKAILTGNADSLKGLRISFPVRMALGIMYYDTTAKKHIKYQYRISAVNQNTSSKTGIITDTISLPFYQKFDSIVLSSSSYNKTIVTVKWKSVGKNPAPLFMVYKNKYDLPVVARGTISRYNMNDTSFYVYTDSVLVTESGRELQYFVVPFDQYGNAGSHSQVYLVPLDGFNKGEFLINQVEFVPTLSGVRIAWKFSKPNLLKSVELYKSETATIGFSKVADISPADTVFIDKLIWPERTYFYYVQVISNDNKRTRQSKILNVTIPGIGMPDQLTPPALRKVEMINGKPRLVIEINDPIATHVRIYRGIPGGLKDLPLMCEVNQKKMISFSDSTYDVKTMNGFVYAVRNEKQGARVSKLSEELIPEIDATPGEIEFFVAFPNGNRVELHWDDIIKKENKYNSYTLARKLGASNSRSPLTVLTENLKEGYFIDTIAVEGNQYTYELRVLDKAGNSSEKTYKVTTTP